MALKKIKIGVSSSTILLLLAFPVSAQNVEDSIIELDQIVIDADLIGRDWKRTGTSFEVLYTKELENRPVIDSVADVLEETVNVTVPTGAGKAPNIRGVDGTGPAEGANAFFAGSRPRMGLRIDGRPASFNEIISGNTLLWDVEKVEVLRGPQSTLAGRNAIAGTVAVTTKDPTFKYSGAMEASVGSFDGRRVAGAVSGPIIKDFVALRLSGDWQAGKSAVNYQPFAGVDNPGDRESFSMRAKLLAYPKLGQASTLRVTASHTSHEGPVAEIIVRPFNALNSNSPQQPVHKVIANSLGAEFNVDFSDVWRFEIDTSFTDFAFIRTVAPTAPSKARLDLREFSIDPRIRYSGANGFKALVGAHVNQARQDEFINLFANLNFKDVTDIYAAYGEVIIPFYEEFELSVGARYERERHKRNGGDAAGVIATINSDRTFDAFLPRIGLNWQPTSTQSYGMHVSKGYNAGGGGISFGFPNPFPVIQYEYDTETVWNYEVYGRQELMNGRLRLTQNLFYSRYSDMQLPFDLTPLNTQDELFEVRNADNVVTYGAELGASFDLNDRINLFGNIGLLQTKVEKFPGSGVEGNILFGAPNFTANVGATYSRDQWDASVSARYSDGYFTGINNRPRGKTDPYVIANAKVGYTFGKVRLFAEVKNIFNADGAVAFFPGATTTTDTAVLLQPRNIRVGLNTSF